MTDNSFDPTEYARLCFNDTRACAADYGVDGFDSAAEWADYELEGVAGDRVGDGYCSYEVMRAALLAVYVADGEFYR